MSLERIEVGLVSADASLVDFLVGVFELERQAPTESSVGTVHKLVAAGAVIKVMVPNDPPRRSDGEPFLAAEGIRYLTMFVSGLDDVLQRCRLRGGQVVLDPFEFEPGSRIAIISDPCGNTFEVVGSS